MMIYQKVIIIYLALTYLIMPLCWHCSRDGISGRRDVLYAPGS